MTFTARIVRNSSLWTAWNRHHRTSGILHGVTFRWVAGGDFVTGELGSDAVGRLQGLKDIAVESFGVPCPVEPRIETGPTPSPSPAPIAAMQVPLSLPADLTRGASVVAPPRPVAPTQQPYQVGKNGNGGQHNQQRRR